MPRLRTKTVSPARRRPNRITVMLYQVGSSPSEVAQLEGVSKAHVSRVMRGLTTSARIRKRIESILKKPWDKLVAAQS